MVTTSNLPAPPENKTKKFFDEYFQDPIYLSENEYDIAYAFFFKVTKEASSAKALLASVAQSAKRNNIPLIQVVQSLKSGDQVELNYNLSVFLNSTRASSSFLGFQLNSLPNNFVERNVKP